MLEHFIKQQALECGFDLVGIALPFPSQSYNKLTDWIDKGFHSEMKWMTRNLDIRKNPSLIMENARSIISLGLSYYNKAAIQKPEHNKGYISIYSLGRDYHKVLKGMMKNLWNKILEKSPDSKARFCVDTAPVMEREIAVLAGLGWIGKNNMLINEKIGTCIFLCEIFTDLTLNPDTPVKSRCGTCDKCIPACPTKALKQPYCLDTNRCISYLTIEHRLPFPDEIAPIIGSNIYGCDSCTVSCPFFSRAKQTSIADFHPINLEIKRDLNHQLTITGKEFDDLFSGNPIHRLGIDIWKRNVRNAIVNQSKQKLI